MSGAVKVPVAPLPSTTTSKLPSSEVAECADESLLFTVTVEPGATESGPLNWKSSMVMTACSVSGGVADGSAESDAVGVAGGDVAGEVVGSAWASGASVPEPQPAAPASSAKVASEASVDFVLIRGSRTLAECI